MDWLRRNPLLGVLALVCLLLAAAIGVEAELGANLRDAMRPASGKPALPVEAKLLPPLLATAAEQAYPETVARPLFIPTRRPAPVVVAVPQSTFQKGQFVLAGVIVVGDNRVAMLREKSNGRIYRVEQGKELNGIKVADIQREQVTMTQGGEQEVLTLSVLRPAAGAAIGSAAVQGPFMGIAPPPGAPPPTVLPSGQLAPGAMGGPFPPQVTPQSPAMPVNPSNPSTGTFLRTRAYRLNETANDNANHGISPSATTCTNTPAVASRRATICSGRIRSPIAMPSITWKSGVMK